MSDTETTIRPALTAEEWAEFLAPDGVLGWSLADARPSVIGDSVEGRHGAAALMLYGQPFGFAQEDVEALMSVADYSGEGSIAPEEDIARARSAIQRLAALLPKP